MNNFRSLFWFIIKESVSYVFFLPALIYLTKFLSKKNVLFILNYHNFSMYNNNFVAGGNLLETGYANNFEKQIKFLKRYFDFCYPDHFFFPKKKYDKKLNFLFTFDDGYKDNYEIAFPLLEKYQIPTVFFISTNYIQNNDFIIHDKIKYLTHEQFISKGSIAEASAINLGEKDYQMNDLEYIDKIFNENKPDYRLMMNHREVSELSERGFKIGNHTYKHERLSFLTKQNQFESIKIADDYLKSSFGDGYKHLAYPNGLYNKETLEVLDELKIEYGYTTEGGYNDQNCNKKSMKRIGINVSDSKYLIVLKLLVYSTFGYGKRN